MGQLGLLLVELRLQVLGGGGAGDRLACQARVLAEGVTVTRLLPAYADASAARLPEEWTGAQPAASGEAAP